MIHWRNQKLVEIKTFLDKMKWLSKEKRKEKYDLDMIMKLNLIRWFILVKKNKINPTISASYYQNEIENLIYDKYVCDWYMNW